MHFNLPARAIFVNMKQWNGAFGCIYCTEEGYTAPGDHLHRYWPHQRDCHAGTMFRNAVDALTNGAALSMCTIKVKVILYICYVCI